MRTCPSYQQYGRTSLPHLCLCCAPPAPCSPSSCEQVILQFSSVSQSCLALCDPMNRSTPALSVHHQLLEFTQTHVHQVGDAIQPSNSLATSCKELTRWKSHHSDPSKITFLRPFCSSSEQASSFSSLSSDMIGVLDCF